MHLRWTALLALLLGMVLLGSCTNNSTAQPPPTPVITGLFPSSITAGSQMFNIFISGTGFVSKPQSLVFWNGSMRTSVLNSTTNQLVVTILASDVATAGVGAITVTNPEPGGPSLAATFVINPVQNGSPSISSLNPPSATPGSGAFTLTVNGSNFVAPVIANGVTQIAGSTVAWNSGPLPTTFVSASQITASVPANDIASPNFASVSVYNTTPGDTQVYSPAVDFEFTTNGSAFPKVASVNAAGGSGGRSERGAGDKRRRPLRCVFFASEEFSRARREGEHFCSRHMFGRRLVCGEDDRRGFGPRRWRTRCRGGPASVAERRRKIRCLRIQGDESGFRSAKLSRAEIARAESFCARSLHGRERAFRLYATYPIRIS